MHLRVLLAELVSVGSPAPSNEACDANHETSGNCFRWSGGPATAIAMLLQRTKVTLAHSAQRISTKLRWCIVLAEDGSEQQSLQRLSRVLGMQGTEDLDARLSFADIRQTDGNFHASIAKNTSHRFGMECIDPQDGDLREHVLVNLLVPPKTCDFTSHSVSRSTTCRRASEFGFAIWPSYERGRPKIWISLLLYRVTESGQGGGGPLFLDKPTAGSLETSPS